jgi:hypothetical protein
MTLSQVMVMHTWTLMSQRGHQQNQVITSCLSCHYLLFYMNTSFASSSIINHQEYGFCV